MKQKPVIKPGMPGAARVEYFACREDVENMQAQGYPVSYIHKHLKGQGRVTCSYSAFCDYVRGGGKRKHSKKKKLPAAPLEQPRKGPIIAAEKKLNPFDISSVDVSTLI